MAEAEELRGKGIFSLANGVSRDPLHLCVNGSSFPGNFSRKIQIKEEKNGADKETVEDGGEEGIELSLGLSLNGKFGVDPNRAQRLKRSSSISNLALNGDYSGARAFSAYAPLTRTCSLPTDAEAETEEWRKRKEAQSQKRMEAKRKRMEKLKNVRVVRGKLDKEDPHCEENGSLYGNGLGLVGSNGNALPSSQGSSVSQGTGSSGISDFESQPLQVCSKNVEARSPSVHFREHELRPPVIVEAAAPAVNNSANSDAATAKDAKEMLRNVMLNMPCVSTKGDGPNGKKIEGFLYRYRKGEEVRIVCVCHGSFLSPAEFVKHAGGGNVEQPLKHIIVSPSSFF